MGNWICCNYSVKHIVITWGQYCQQKDLHSPLYVRVYVCAHSCFHEHNAYEPLGLALQSAYFSLMDSFKMYFGYMD